MMIALHKNARITPAIRSEVKAAEASSCTLATRWVRAPITILVPFGGCLPVGRTPVVKAINRCFSMNRLSAASAQGRFGFMLRDGVVDAQVCDEFLKRLLGGAKQPVFLIVDERLAHKAKRV